MDNNTVIVGDDSTSHDYYFDSNVGNDSGNGSIDNPYKTLTSSKLLDNSKIHLADGRYVLDKMGNVNNVTIIGNGPEKTIISYANAIGFQLRGSLTLNNVTLLYIGIKNNGGYLFIFIRTREAGDLAKRPGLLFTLLCLDYGEAVIDRSFGF